MGTFSNVTIIIFRKCVKVIFQPIECLIMETRKICIHIFKGIFGTNWQKFLIVLVHRQKWYFDPSNFYPCTLKKCNHQKNWIWSHRKIMNHVLIVTCHYCFSIILWSEKLNAICRFVVECAGLFTSLILPQFNLRSRSWLLWARIHGNDKAPSDVQSSGRMMWNKGLFYLGSLASPRLTCDLMRRTLV